MMLKDIAARAEIPAALTHRYLVSYIRVGLVEQDEISGRYGIGGFALQLGLKALSRLNPVRAALPKLAELSERLDQTIVLGIWAEQGPVVIHWFESSRPVNTSLRTGSVAPLLSSATGRIFGAFLPRRQTAAVLRRELASARKIGTAIPATQQEADEMFAAVRRAGVARVAGTLVPGIHGVAAPVFGAPDGRLVLGIAAVGHVEVFDSSLSGPIAKAIKKTADELSRRLGGQLGSTALQ
jgi:DNA-binding IclR family transcriptional regulator